MIFPTQEFLFLQIIPSNLVYCNKYNGGTEMDEQSLRPIIEKLETLFSKFNEHFYQGGLQRPIITVNPDSRRSCYGWCTGWKAWSNSGGHIDVSGMYLPESIEMQDEGFYEINICAEYLSRHFTEVAGTLLHEMAHLYNLQLDIQDTSRNGTYHNKHYKRAAEMHGLIVERDVTYGWARTGLNAEAQEYIKSLGNQQFQLFRRSRKGADSRRQSTRKYICPNCGCIVRATKEVNIICADCRVPFIETR